MYDDSDKKEPRLKEFDFSGILILKGFLIEHFLSKSFVILTG